MSRRGWQQQHRVDSLSVETPHAARSTAKIDRSPRAGPHMAGGVAGGSHSPALACTLRTRVVEAAHRLWILFCWSGIDTASLTGPSPTYRATRPVSGPALTSTCEQTGRLRAAKRPPARRSRGNGFPDHPGVSEAAPEGEQAVSIQPNARRQTALNRARSADRASIAGTGALQISMRSSTCSARASRLSRTCRCGAHRPSRTLVHAGLDQWMGF